MIIVLAYEIWQKNIIKCLFHPYEIFTQKYERFENLN